MGKPLRARDGFSRRTFLVAGGSAATLLAIGPSCAFDLGSDRQDVIIGLHVHEVDGFLHFETSVPSGELFAGNGAGGFLEWGITHNYSTELWDDGFCRFSTFP